MNVHTDAEIAYVKDFIGTLVEEPLDYKRLSDLPRHEVDQASKLIVTNKIFQRIVSGLIDKWKDDLIYAGDAQTSHDLRVKILSLRDLMTTLLSYASHIKE